MFLFHLAEESDYSSLDINRINTLLIRTNSPYCIKVPVSMRPPKQVVF